MAVPKNTPFCACCGKLPSGRCAAPSQAMPRSMAASVAGGLSGVTSRRASSAQLVITTWVCGCSTYFSSRQLE